jgi:hypothetical protein
LTNREVQRPKDWAITMAQAIQAPVTQVSDNSVPSLDDGTLLAGRYRVSHRIGPGWFAYDERLTRPVLIETIVAPGSPAERVRHEASKGGPLLDAVVYHDHAFAVRTPPPVGMTPVRH